MNDGLTKGGSPLGSDAGFKRYTRWCLVPRSCTPEEAHEHGAAFLRLSAEMACVQLVGEVETKVLDPEDVNDPGWLHAPPADHEYGDNLIVIATGPALR